MFVRFIADLHVVLLLFATQLSDTLGWYRGRCLLVHPDKLKASFGRQAFQSLSSAKDALLQQLDTGVVLNNCLVPALGLHNSVPCSYWRIIAGCRVFSGQSAEPGAYEDEFPWWEPWDEQPAIPMGSGPGVHLLPTILYYHLCLLERRTCITRLMRAPCHLSC